MVDLARNCQMDRSPYIQVAHTLMKFTVDNALVLKIWHTPISSLSQMMYLFERHKGKKQQESERVIASISGSHTNGCNARSGPMPKLGTWNSTQVFHTGGRVGLQ